MRKNKIVAVMLLVFVLALSFVLTACVTDEHQCTSKCPECGKCLNKECTQEACKEKCPGHEEKPEHVCGHKCPTCGKCTDTTCTDPVCADKCPGHEPTPPAHECTSKCPVCGKCTNKDCTEEVCKDKCQGHHPDTCQHVCATCGGCYNETCTDPICATKCDCISGLENAKEYVRTLYIDASKEATSANYDLVDHVRVKEPHSGVMTDYAVSWTITVDASVPVPATVAKGEGKWTVTVSTEKFSTDQPYKLVATVTDSEGNTLTTSFNRYVPAYKTYSYDEYVKAADDADVVVQGIVTGIISKTNGNKSNGLYLQSLDNKGGFYIYNMANDPVTDKIEVGMKVEAAGKKDVFNGTLEVIDATVTVLEKTPATVTPVDLTEAFKAASDLKATTLTYGQALLVKLTGITVLPQDGDTANGYYKFQLGDKTSYVRISSSVCPMVKDAQTTMIANHKAKTGYTADVVGLVTLYSGSFYLTPVSADAFSNFQLATLTGQEAIDAEKELISFKNVEEDTIIDLIANGKNYKDVTITWAFKENTTHTTATIENGKLIVVLGDEPETITLVATFTEGAVTDTKTYEFTVDAASTQEYIPEAIKEAKVGTFKFGLQQQNLDQFLYFDGEINSSEYLTTTTKASKAADVVVAAVDGGYTLKVGSKYIEVYKNSSDKYRVTLVDAATGKWTWNDDAKLFVYNVGGTDYFLGTYNNFNTISASAVSYISGDKAGNLDKTQFAARITTLIEADYKLNQIESATVGTYKFGLYQATLGKTLYFAGEINSSEYLTTTEKFSKAADVVVAAVDGGYTLKVGSKYIEVYKNSSDKYRVTLVDAATGKWTWNDDAKLFVYNVGGTDYFLGTYNNFNTISASAVSYITGDKAGNIGKTQFVAQLGVRGFKNTQPDPTPATDEQKVAAAEKAIGTTLTISKTGETELYTSTDVTVTWAINGETTLATLAGNKLTVAALPTDADGTFTLTATIKSGEVEKTVDVTVTVKKAVTTVNDGTAEKPYTVEEVVAVTANLAKDEYTESMVYVKGIVKSFEKGTFAKNIYLVDEAGSTVSFLVYSANFTETVKEIAVGDTIVVKGAVKNYNGTIEMTNVKVNNETVHGFPSLISCTAGQGTISIAEGSSDKATVTIANDQKTGENYTTFVFEVNVAEGYELVSVKVDGVVVTAENGKYTGRIAGNTLISVETKVAGAKDPVVVGSLTFLAPTQDSVNDYVSTWSATNDFSKWTLTNFNNNNNNTKWTYVRAGSKSAASVASIVNATAMTDAITKIAVTFDKISLVNSVKLIVARDAACTDVVETVEGSATQKGEQIFNISNPTGGLYYKLVIDCQQSNKTAGNGTVQISKIDYYAVK